MFIIVKNRNLYNEWIRYYDSVYGESMAPYEKRTYAWINTENGKNIPW